MKIEQTRWMEKSGWEPTVPGRLGDAAQLALVFGSTVLMKNAEYGDIIRKAYPHARLIGCSTAGEICGTHVTDDSLVVTAVQFDGATCEGSHINIREVKNSFQ